MSENDEKVTNLNPHQAQCHVCLSGHSAEIDKKFINYESTTKQLAEEYGISEASLNKHIKYFELKAERARKSIPLINKLIEQGVECLNPAKMKASDITKLLELKAKLEGDLVERHKLDITDELLAMDVSQIKGLLKMLGGTLVSEVVEIPCETSKDELGIN